MKQMSKEECAKGYYARLKYNPSKEQAIQIAEEINNLVYADSGEKLIGDDKIAIVKAMVKNKNGIYPVLEHADNQNILELISLIMDIVKDTEKRG